ncbi:MAG: hypothetical protein JZU50_06795 [Desulfobulbaceae bacterium]|nr:hypothetical protein [Desulfobulbaceae bacterium]
MKIAESALQFTSAHTVVEFSERRESLTVWQQGKDPVSSDRENNRDRKLEAKAMAFAEQATKVSLSAAARQKVPELAELDPLSEEDSLVTDLNMRILKGLFEKLTGRKFKLYDPGAVKQQDASPAVPAAEQSPEVPTAAGWGVQYERHETYHESETSQFSAQGVVLTTDGQQIEIAVELNLSRSFTSTLDESFRAGAALKDPLVINFGGTAAQLTQNKFSFDIDADGNPDQVSFVTPGSGFLALDANNDGTVNNGSELFGALSGDGFAELAAYDGDGNGWIDENDAIFSRLRIWSKTAAGEDQLLAMIDQGVGALYLGRISTPFAVKDSSNALQGQVVSTGIFLREEGGAGTIQQLDLVA